VGEVVLPLPVLDDRSYEQLRDELLRRAAVFAPEWTDRGPSDPGVTLLELVAFLGENLLFRFNQIPDQTRLWLLRLLQVPPQAARPARGLVTFTPDPPDQASPPPVPLGTAVSAGDVSFVVANDVRPVPLVATAVIKAPAPLPEDPALQAQAQAALDAAGLASGEVPELFAPSVLGPDPAAPGFVPLDVSQAIDQTLWVAVLGLPGASPSTLDGLFTADGPLAGDPLVLGFASDTVYPTLEEVDPCAGLDSRPEHARVELAAAVACAADVGVAGPESPGEAPGLDTTLHWQVSTTVATEDGLPEYLPVPVVRDTTEGLGHDGVVGLRLPAADLDRIGAPALDDPDLAGVGDRPPPLDGDATVLFWLRAFPRQGSPEIGVVRWLGLNAADVEQVAEAVPEFVGTGTGMPNQELGLVHDSVVPGTLQVEVEEFGRWEPWEVVETLAASTRTDRHVVLDAPAGRIRCGDTVRGRTFGIGDRIRAVRYRYGGGRAGNVAPGAIETAESIGGLAVANPLPTVGGEDPETITRALDRIPGELARHDRAVTAGDFEELAMIPGVGRADCLPLFDPNTRSTDATGRFDAAGVVSVVVWPTEDPRHPDAPLPDTALLRAVCERLDARRLVTTELYVVPPTYHRVAVSVGLAVRDGYSAVGVRRWVELVLRQYLAPLPPYGPAGVGWPLGHRVHGPELEAAVLQVEGVDFLDGLEVADLGGGTVTPGTVELEGWEVPELAELTVVVGPPPPAGSGGVQPPAGPTPVPVPVPKVVC
jgi:predicted phage baseplate assembly protein